MTLRDTAAETHSSAGPSMAAQPPRGKKSKAGDYLIIEVWQDGDQQVAQPVWLGSGMWRGDLDNSKRRANQLSPNADTVAYHVVPTKVWRSEGWPKDRPPASVAKLQSVHSVWVKPIDKLHEAVRAKAESIAPGISKNNLIVCSIKPIAASTEQPPVEARPKPSAAPTAKAKPRVKKDRHIVVPKTQAPEPQRSSAPERTIPPVASNTYEANPSEAIAYAVDIESSGVIDPTLAIEKLHAGDWIMEAIFDAMGGNIDNPCDIDRFVAELEATVREITSKD